MSVEEKRKHGTDLVEFQNRLNLSLDAADKMGRSSSMIGFSTAGKYWLADLSDLREVSGVPAADKVVKLAVAKEWVQGMSNFKGNIYTLVDFQMLLGQAATVLNFNSRAILFHPKHLLSTALVVQTVLGLVNAADLSPAKDDGTPWTRETFKSEDGIVWHMLDIAVLSESKELLDIEA